jgi:cell shape-determining protein MreC
VSNLVDVEPGERVMTSGQDGLYLPGFVIGTVEEVSAGPLFREITVRPAVDFSHIDLVLVLLALPPLAEGGGS